MTHNQSNNMSIMDEFDALRLETDQIHNLQQEIHERIEKVEEMIAAQTDADADAENPLLRIMEDTHADILRQIDQLGVTDFLHRLLEQLDHLSPDEKIEHEMIDHMDE